MLSGTPKANSSNSFRPHLPSGAHPQRGSSAQLFALVKVLQVQTVERFEDVPEGHAAWTKVRFVGPNPKSAAGFAVLGDMQVLIPRTVQLERRKAGSDPSRCEKCI